MQELLAQLVGARSYAVYFLDVERRRLEPIATDGVELAEVPPVPFRTWRRRAWSRPPSSARS